MHLSLKYLYHHTESALYTLLRKNYIKRGDKNWAQILRGGTGHIKLKCLTDVLLYIPMISFPFKCRVLIVTILS